MLTKASHRAPAPGSNTVPLWPAASNIMAELIGRGHTSLLMLLTGQVCQWTEGQFPGNCSHDTSSRKPALISAALLSGCFSVVPQILTMQHHLLDFEDPSQALPPRP